MHGLMDIPRALRALSMPSHAIGYNPDERTATGSVVVSIRRSCVIVNPVIYSSLVVTTPLPPGHDRHPTLPNVSSPTPVLSCLLPSALVARARDGGVGGVLSIRHWSHSPRCDRPCGCAGAVGTACTPFDPIGYIQSPRATLASERRRFVFPDLK